ncbi:MAG: glycine dehydrogenase, partial [Nitrospira sp.]
MSPQSFLNPIDTFVHRHIGPTDADIQEMLATLGLKSLDTLVEGVVPEDIRMRQPLTFGAIRGEFDVLAELRAMHDRNQVFRSFIGMGYHDCITPPVIQRNILENPGWYTQYTPYQAEIAQGRLEALLNFQTMIADLTGLPCANASLLDDATAAAEAMTMCHRLAHRTVAGGAEKTGFFVAKDCDPQTIAVIQTRAEPLGITLHIGGVEDVDFAKQDLFGLLLQYPTTDGTLRDDHELIETAHTNGALVVVSTDLLALTLLKPPGEFGADIAVGSSQRFGVPMGFGGPHAAFLSCKQDYVRQMPGRIVGVSRDKAGRPAYRLTLQTREQHIRRDKANSNICTAQVLLAVMASMYAVYHGPEGLKRIAERVHGLTVVLAEGLRRLGYEVGPTPSFGTLKIRPMGRAPHQSVPRIVARAIERRINFRRHEESYITISLDEVTTPAEVQTLFEIFAGGQPVPFSVQELSGTVALGYPKH